jgi:V-type H+-transporting ATPase proteolipid subunit
MGVYSNNEGGASVASLYPYLSISGLGLVGLYMLLTGSGEQFNVGEFLMSINPHMWALLGIALCVGLSVGGAAW